MYVAEEFQMYVSREPVEPWGYDLDDHAISYGPGFWPWHRYYHATRHNAEGVFPGSVRLAPDDTYEAGDQRYLLAWPRDYGCSLDLSWMVRPQGLGGIVRVVEVRLGMDLAILDPVPAEVREEVERRVEKFRTLYRKAIAERDAGVKEPVTAYDRYMQREAEASRRKEGVSQ